jgi:hypothetical protein
MVTSAADWIKQRLPADAIFSKNGIEQNADEAIDAALADHTDQTDVSPGFSQRKYALADLLDILAADVKYRSEKLGDWTGTDQVLSDRAAALREEAGSDTGQPGSFSFVPATYGSHAARDEFSVG